MARIVSAHDMEGTTFEHTTVGHSIELPAPGEHDIEIQPGSPMWEEHGWTWGIDPAIGPNEVQILNANGEIVRFPLHTAPAPVERRPRPNDTPELLAHLDAVLADGGQQSVTDGWWRSDETTPTQRLETDPNLPTVDNPIRRGPEDTEWTQVALRAWEALTGETVLPDWFDDFTTIGELARRTGKEREEIRDALDSARDSVTYENGWSGLGVATPMVSIEATVISWQEVRRRAHNRLAEYCQRIVDSFNRQYDEVQAIIEATPEQLAELAERFQSVGTSADEAAALFESFGASMVVFDDIDIEPGGPRNRAERRGHRTRPGHVSPHGPAINIHTQA